MPIVYKNTGIGSVGVTPPGGADTEVQFNDGGVFGGDASFRWLKASSVLYVGNKIGINDLSPSAMLDIMCFDANTEGINIQAAASPNVGLLSAENSSGTSLLSLTNDFTYRMDNPSQPGDARAIEFTSVDSAGASGANMYFRPVSSSANGMNLFFTPNNTAGLKNNSTSFRVYASDFINNVSSDFLYISTGWNQSRDRFQIWPRNNGTYTAVPFEILVPGTSQDQALTFQTSGEVIFNENRLSFIDVRMATPSDANLFFMDAGANLVTINNLSINSAYTFPVADGNSDELMKTDGSGNIDFAAIDEFNLSVVTTTDAVFNAALTNSVILCDCSSNNITVNLPTAVGNSGKKFSVKKIDGTGNTVTIDPSGGQTIDGAATRVISTQYEVSSPISDGSNYYDLNP